MSVYKVLALALSPSSFLHTTRTHSSESIPSYLDNPSSLSQSDWPSLPILLHTMSSLVAPLDFVDPIENLSAFQTDQFHQDLWHHLLVEMRGREEWDVISAKQFVSLPP